MRNTKHIRILPTFSTEMLMEDLIRQKFMSNRFNGTFDSSECSSIMYSPRELSFLSTESNEYPQIRAIRRFSINRGSPNGKTCFGLWLWLWRWRSISSIIWHIFLESKNSYQVCYSLLFHGILLTNFKISFSNFRIKKRHWKTTAATSIVRWLKRY